MFPASPRPLPPGLLLRELLALVQPGHLLGAWVRCGRWRLPVHHLSSRAASGVLPSSDLGFLLRRCSEVAIAEGDTARVLPSGEIIPWRSLQVVTAMPHPPGLERLRTHFPGLRLRGNRLLIPMQGESSEAVLARCVEEGVRVTRSRVVYRRWEACLPPPYLPS